jgi:hypothetical protein
MVSDFVDNKIEDDENDEELETPRMWRIDGWEDDNDKRI